MPAPSYPHLYLRVSSLIGYTGAFIGVLALYIMIIASPKEMRAYKYCLMVMQIFSMAFDIMIHGFLPEIYTPAFAGKFYGILYEVFHVPGTIIYALMATGFWGIALGTILCFLYRHQVVLPDEHWARFRWSFWALFLSCHGIFYLGLTVWPIFALPLEHPSNASGLTYILETYPDMSWLQFDEDAWIGDVAASLAPPYVNIQCIGMIFFVTTAACIEIMPIGVILIWQIFYYLKNASSYLSDKTRAMHKRFINALLIQVGVPTLTIVGPLLSSAVIGWGTPVSQEYRNMMFMCAMFHGKLTSILIIALIQPYQKYCVDTLRKMIGITKRNNETTAVSSRT